MLQHSSLAGALHALCRPTGRGLCILQRLLQQIPTPFGERTGLGTDVLQGVAPCGKGSQAGLVSLRLPRGQEAKKLDCRRTVACGGRDGEGVRARVDVTSGRTFRIESYVEAVYDGALVGIEVRVETAGPVGAHGGPSFAETGGYLVVIPVRGLRGRCPLIEVFEQPECPAARIFVQARSRRTLVLEHPASGHGV